MEATLILILFLAFLAESTVEYLFKPWTRNLREPLDDEVPKYIGLAAGILLCSLYRADLPAMFGFQAVHPAVGIAITGTLVGRGSNVVHDAIKRLRGEVQPLPPAAPIPEAPPFA